MTLYILNRFIIATLLLFSIHTCYSQPATRHHIDSTLATIDTAFKTKRGVFYVINGIPYDSLQLDEELKQYDLRSIVEMRFITCEKSNLPHCVNDVAVVVFAYNQKNEVKRKAWKNATRLFADSLETPLLLINNSVINQEVSEQTFEALRLKQIKYIDIAEQSNNQQIRVWTKEIK